MVPVGGIASVAASFGIGIMLLWSGRYHHQEIDGVEIYGYAPPFYYFFVVVSVFCCVGLLYFAFSSFTENTYPAMMVFGGGLIVTVPSALVVKYQHIQLRAQDIARVWPWTISIAYSDVAKIVEIVSARQGSVRSGSGKRIMLWATFVDVPDLILQLKMRCPNAEYVRKL